MKHRCKRLSSYCLSVLTIAAVPVLAQELAMLRDPTAPVQFGGQPPQGVEKVGGQMFEMLGVQRPSETPSATGLQGKLQALTGSTREVGGDVNDKEPAPGTVGLRMVVLGGFEADAHAAAFHDNAWYRVGSGARVKTLTGVTRRGAQFRSNGVEQFLPVVEHAVVKVRLSD